jgi:hypothetical protein
MFNHTTDVKALVIAASALAIALLTMCVGVNCTWAGSGQSSGLEFTPITPRAAPHSTYRLVQACAGFHNECSTTNPNIPRCCGGFVCVSNPNATGRTWCERQ